MLPLLFTLAIGMLIPLYFIAIFSASAYHKLLSLRNCYKNAYAQIDPELKHLHDLILDLVETCKRHLQHEPGPLEAIIAGLNSASAASLRVAQSPGDAAAMTELATAESVLTKNLGRLVALAQADPDLSGNKSIKELMIDLATTEIKIAVARQTYNDAVLSYNKCRRGFPHNCIAGTFKFPPAALFEIEESAEKETP